MIAPDDIYDWGDGTSSGGIFGGGSPSGKSGGVFGDIGSDPGALFTRSGSGGPTPPNQGLGDFGDNPFGYTANSLLTPWTQPLPELRPTASGAFTMDPFSYADLNYTHRGIGPMQSRADFGLSSNFEFDPYTASPDFNYSAISAANPLLYTDIERPQQFSFGQPVPNIDSFAAAPVPDVGSFAAGQPVPTIDPLTYQSVTAPGGFSAVDVPISGANAPRFDYSAFSMPEGFQAPSGFSAPVVSEDPGFKFRLQKGLDAMQNTAAARGTLRGGDTLMALNDYAQQEASNEYANAWQRAFATHNQDFANRLQAYQTDTGTRMTANAQIFGQGATAFDLNRLARTSADALRMQAQGMNVNAEQTAADLRMRAEMANAANAGNAWQMNTQARLGAQQQAFQQALAGHQTNTQAQQAADMFNRQMAAQAWGLNADNAFRTASTNEQNRLAAWQASEAARQGAYGLNFTAKDRALQAKMQAHNMDYQNALAAYNANVQENLGSGALGFQVASGLWDRNYQKALQQWNSAYGMGSAAAGASASAANADYNNQLQQYRMAYDIFQNNQSNQFNRLYALANMGQQSAGALSGQAMNMGQLWGSNVTQGANAAASGVMGGAGAWGNAVGAIGNAAGTGLLFGSPFGQEILGIGGTAAPPPPIDFGGRVQPVPGPWTGE